MIRALIVEDEINNREILGSLLDQYCKQVEVVDYATDANEAVEKIQSLRPDLVFLDIVLPFGNAFDILSRVKEINFYIVFTTAYDKYVIRAIKVGATDYLLKPIDHAELAETVRRVEASMAEKKEYLNMEQLMSAFSKQLHSNNIALPTMEGYNFIKFDDIIVVTAEGNYCKIYCLGNQTYTVTKQIHEIEEKLPQAVFCRIHNSHIINMKHIREYVKGRGGYVVMVDGSQVDVSLRRKDQFLERFS